VVVPNGTLFGDGVCAGIKEELIEEFDLDGKNPAAREDSAHRPRQHGAAKRNQGNLTTKITKIAKKKCHKFLSLCSLRSMW
jgi:hypothetical protein